MNKEIELTYLKESDLKNPCQYPLIDYLNIANGQGLFKFLSCISNDHTIGYDGASGIFWHELDEYDKSQIKPYEGILVEVDYGSNSEIIVSNEDLVYYLKLLVSRKPMTKEKKDQAYALIHQFAEKHGIKD